jgi:hypothetical protein
MMGTGLLLFDRMVLGSAAYEAAVAGAQQNGDCASALGRVEQLLDRAPSTKDCQRTGPIIEVTLTDDFAFSFGIFPSVITVTGSAVVRDPDPVASPSASP